MNINYLLLSLLIFSINQVLAANNTTPASDCSKIEEIVSTFITLEEVPVELDFANFLAELNSKNSATKLKEKLSILKAITLKLEQIFQEHKDSKQSSLCELSQLWQLNFNVALSIERTKLLLKSNKTVLKYEGNFLSLEAGEQWYKHWLKSWLMNDISIKQLKRYAFRELLDAENKRLKLNESRLPTNNASYESNDKKSIISSFKERERRVNLHLEEVLNSAFVAPAVSIVESNLPKSFPAPGIYNTDTKQFIYHPQEEYYPVKSMDWLFLHEAVPGHYYQDQFVSSNAICINRSVVFSPVFAEGWGAYVETLGDELGLYNDRSSFNYALDWQVLRAVRVLLDIGIHSEGWSDAKAKHVWRQYIPNENTIMEREIARIKRWPAQVITYVYAKVQIQNAILNIQNLYPDVKLADIRQSVLTFSNQPLSQLNELLSEHFSRPKPKQSKIEEF